MKYYIDIKLESDTEISLGFIWEKVYAQMHLAMVNQKDSEGMCKVGFSFPKYESKVFPIGDILRLFAPTKEELKLLNIEEYLKRLSEYVLISEIKEVPTNINAYVTFSRKQFKINKERLVRRQAKRQGISIEEARENYKDFDEENKRKENKLPYINMNSLSNQNKMKVFIDKTVKTEVIKGLFTTYGLSKTSTVPYF
ncbi:type I-F CRISPR-associated endoribonuclease Cas6/Csy4 [Poseidonibacter antarcticus]|uniref:type I-F CRISPR-associated endoribonuclease Cas6/Csy4 n=1 Tax=Poseidonibacter antarcticus TaxID=2478538 RepID=UPI000EF4716F|nr:type I-F CRISPR-associated endoribonuclease Cas6/Csy4 [Poseidonibacter antarcticus]